MEEKINRVDRLRGKAEMRSKIAIAMNETIAEVALINNMGGENAHKAMMAVADALESDVAAHTHEELRKLAEDAAERSFASFGFDSPKVLADLYVKLDGRLNAS